MPLKPPSAPVSIPVLHEKISSCRGNEVLKERAALPDFSNIY